MQTSVPPETFWTIIITTFLILTFILLLVTYFFYQQKRRFVHLQEMADLTKTFQQTILQSKLEIQELTLDHVAKELHANFSHLVSLVNINLSAALSETGQKAHGHVLEAKQLTKQLMTDVKALSVSMNSDHIMKSGFYNAFVREMQRLEKTGKYEVVFETDGSPFRFPAEKEIVLLRLTQEILHNIVRHAKASKVEAVLAFTEKRLVVKISDNGIGFDLGLARAQSIERSSTGLMNISGRAEHIQAKLEIKSNIGEGTTVIVDIDFN